MNAKPNPSRNRQQRTSQQKNGAPNPGLETPSAGREEASPETQRKCRKTNDGEKHWLEYATAGFALVAAIGGIVAAIFSGYQGWVARDNEKRQLRAYVTAVPSGGSLDPVLIGSPLIARLKIKNYGQTPAQHLHSEGGLFFTAKNPIDSYTPLGPRRFGSTVIEDKTVVSGYEFDSDVFTDRITNEQMAEAVRVNATVIVLYIVLIYQDIFGIERHSNICIYFLDYVHPPARGNFCRNHNDSD